MLGQDRVLVEELVEDPVRLQESRRRLALQPGAALVDPAGQQRSERQRGGDLEHLGNHAVDHSFTAIRVTISVRKLYSR
jgi:hypothetical protein